MQFAYFIVANRLTCRISVPFPHVSCIVIHSLHILTPTTAVQYIGTSAVIVYLKIGLTLRAYPNGGFMVKYESTSLNDVPVC